MPPRFAPRPARHFGAASRAARSGAAVLVLVVLVGCGGDGQVGRLDDEGQAGYVSGSGTVTTIAPAEREPAPAFSGPLLGGGSFDLEEARGDVVVINVWGSWCPPCRAEAPDLQAAYEDLRDRGVRFVGVNIKDTEQNARAFLDEFGVTYPTVYDEIGDRMLAFSDTLPPTAVPSTLVVDRQGRMAARVLGQISKRSLADLVEPIAAEGAPAA